MSIFSKSGFGLGLTLPNSAKPCYKSLIVTSIEFRLFLGYSVGQETGEGGNPLVKEVDHG